MKAFQFRLARVLHIRQAQERTEQQKLDRLQALRVQVESEMAALDESLVQAQQRLRSETSLYAAELTQLQSYERGVEKSRERLRTRLSEQAQAIAAQSALVVVARRNVKLLEKLRDKQKNDWKGEADRELESLSSDFAAAQWIRLRSRP